MQALQSYYWKQPLGAIVGTRLGPFPLPQHVGILAPHAVWGRSVISFKPRGKVEEPVHQFANGRPFDSVSCPTNLSWQLVIQRARDAVPTKPYDLLNFNCDYFVRHCHGLKLESPQVGAIAVLTVIGFTLAWAAAA